MNKAILVIDMPKTCFECPICASYAESAFSPREYWCPMMSNRDASSNIIQNWCPLKPLPDKRNENGTWILDGYIDDRYSQGWNDCIEEILGK